MGNEPSSPFLKYNSNSNNGLQPNKTLKNTENEISKLNRIDGTTAYIKRNKQQKIQKNILNFKLNNEIIRNKLIEENKIFEEDCDSNSPIANNNDYLKQNSPTYALNVSNRTNVPRERIRSISVCAAQLKMSNDCQAFPSLGSAVGGGSSLINNARKASIIGNSHPPCVMPPLTRLRIQQSFRNAKPVIGHKILKRASTLRTELKLFVNNLNKETIDQLAMNIFRLVTNCVVNVDFPSKVSSISFAFGEIFAQLCIFGFRPDFFSTIADAMVAECVRQDGGAQKRCETLLAWSQLMQFIFSNVRDGYYAEVRQQRRSSLPQQRFLLKQNNLYTTTGRGSL